MGIARLSGTAKEDVDGTAKLDSDVCLNRITEALNIVKVDYRDVESSFRNFYDKSGQEKID